MLSHFVIFLSSHQNLCSHFLHLYGFFGADEISWCYFHYGLWRPFWPFSHGAGCSLPLCLLSSRLPVLLEACTIWGAKSCICHPLGRSHSFGTYSIFLDACQGRNQSNFSLCHQICIFLPCRSDKLFPFSHLMQVKGFSPV